MDTYNVQDYSDVHSLRVVMYCSCYIVLFFLYYIYVLVVFLADEHSFIVSQIVYVILFRFMEVAIFKVRVN